MFSACDGYRYKKAKEFCNSFAFSALVIKECLDLNQVFYAIGKKAKESERKRKNFRFLSVFCLILSLYKSVTASNVSGNWGYSMSLR